MSVSLLSGKKYNLIYCDPPWQYRDKCNSGNRGACHKYETMSIHDLYKLPIDEFAADDCLLAMWWVPPMPAEALAVIAVWGFKLKTMTGFTWHKTTKHGKDHFGMGNWTRANSESCLFATRGKPKRASAAISQIVTAPIGIHSAKPVIIREKLTALMGGVPRIELFARTLADGWDSWGLEVEGIKP